LWLAGKLLLLIDIWLLYIRLRFRVCIWLLRLLRVHVWRLLLLHIGFLTAMIWGLLLYIRLL
jgi:hypothetical protein